MLPASGGGGAGTDWSAMSVPDMWLAVGNQDTTGHWNLVNGWRKSFELTLMHMSQVKSYRDNLATAWPPEKSPAAAAYVGRLNELISHLQGTYDAAVANYSAFSGATLALAMARTDLKKVVDEYSANQQKLAEFEANPPQRPAGSRYLPPPPKPPVADGRQAELEAQARTIMYGLSSEIVQARTQITKPAKYSPRDGRDDSGARDDGLGYVAPSLPLIVPFNPGNSSMDSRAQATQSTTSGPGQVAGVNPRSSTNLPDIGRPPGLILGGIQPTSIAPVPSITGIALPAPVAGIASPPPFGGASFTPLGSSSPTLPNSRTAKSVSGSQAPGVGESSGSMREATGRAGTSPLPSGAVRAMPTGGVIGGTPAFGLGQLPAGGRSVSQPSVGDRPTVRVNPVGGLLNPSRAGEPPISNPGRAMPFGPPVAQLGARGPIAERIVGASVSTTSTYSGRPTAGQLPSNLGGRSLPHSEKNAEGVRWDPEHPWKTAEGVPPVLMPQTVQPVDPGPAIGLR